MNFENIFFGVPLSGVERRWVCLENAKPEDLARLTELGFSGVGWCNPDFSRTIRLQATAAKTFFTSESYMQDSVTLFIGEDREAFFTIAKAFAEEQTVSLKT